MIEFQLPADAEDEPWHALFAAACGAALPRPPQLRLELSFSDQLPPPAAPSRDADGRYCLCERNYGFSVAASGGLIVLRARPGSQVAPAAPRHLLSAMAGALGLTLLHSAAVRVGGSEKECALVFCGRSGAGKSTIAAMLLAADTRLIDEEMNFLATDDQGKPWVLDCSTPHAAFASLAAGPPEPDGAWIPLDGLFHLKQADACALRELSSAEATAALLTLPLLADDAETVTAHSRRLAEIIKRAPVRELCFTLDTRAVRTFLAGQGIAL